MPSHRSRRRQERFRAHPVDRPITLPRRSFREWFAMEMIIDVFGLIIRGIFWLVGVIWNAFR